MCENVFVLTTSVIGYNVICLFPYLKEHWVAHLFHWFCIRRADERGIQSKGLKSTFLHLTTAVLLPPLLSRFHNKWLSSDGVQWPNTVHMNSDPPCLENVPEPLHCYWTSLLLRSNLRDEGINPLWWDERCEMSLYWSPWVNAGVLTATAVSKVGRQGEQRLMFTVTVKCWGRVVTQMWD